MISLKNILNERIDGHKVICDNCGWSWNIVDGGKDVYTCHKCGHDNTPLNENLNNNEYQMVDGIIDILIQVKNMSNRKEIADKMVQQFKDENIIFDYKKFYKAIGCEGGVNEYNKQTPNERIKGYTERIKSIKDKMNSMEDKTSDTFKLQQGKLKAVTQTLLNYKQQQSIKKATK
jgi:hypothetical protein